MILSAYGLVDVSPHELSTVLQNLRMSHTLVRGVGRTLYMTVDGMCKEQPVWPVVIDRMKAINKTPANRDRMVYFVCDARAALSTSNVSQALWPEYRGLMDITTSVKQALMAANSLTHDWQFVCNEPTIEDYVNIATKPSFFNHVQSAMYKITPYNLRKEVNTMCVAYLAGSVSVTVLKRKLKSSHKLEVLLGLMDSQKARDLRDAVHQARSNTVESVAKSTGFESFEILYVLRSFEKAQA